MRIVVVAVATAASAFASAGTGVGAGGAASRVSKIRKHPGSTTPPYSKLSRIERNQPHHSVDARGEVKRTQTPIASLW
ncbi:hypothetical protein M0802_012330 [Mischocyttarus mexicanus]|nr:hypothetical protein M0802_012330 [Mischocyttarus mexicanus]